MNRFMHAIRHEFSLQGRTVFLGALALAGAFLLFGLLSWLGSVQLLNMWEVYPLPLMILGVLVTSGSFSELRSPGHRIEYLLRPATVWEKAGSKLVVSALGVWIAMTAAFVVASLVAAVFYLVVAGDVSVGVALAGSFANGEWLTIAVTTLLDYLPVHAVFFFGSVFFRKHTLGRTFLAAVTWVGSYAFASVVAGRLIFNRYAQGDYPGTGLARVFGESYGPGESFAFNPSVWQEIAPFYLQSPELIQPVMSVVTVVVFWLLTVLRLRETEA